MKLRLHQYLARSGVAKNNYEITQMIKKGRVCVDHEVVTAESFIFDTKRRRITLDGREVHLQPTRYFLVNKPKGFSCQRGEYPNVADLFANILKNDKRAMQSLFVVGRLDRETEGLLIVTNDGGVASKILQPVENIEKEYEAFVEGSVLEEAIQKLSIGVDIEVEGEKYKTLPARIKLIKRVKIPATQKSSSVVRVVLTEGKKRQVRQMLSVVGHPVISLKRIRIGSLNLSDMQDRWVVELPRTDILSALNI